MLKITRAAVTCAILAAVLSYASAQAAAPAGGTLSKVKRTLSWAGATYNYAIPYPDSSLFCLDQQCDHFKLRINMGDGARINVSITATPTPVDSVQNLGGQGVAPNDFDLFVYSPTGALVASSATPSGDESTTFTHKGAYRNQNYDVMVSPWLVLPGATYKGMITTVKFVR